MSTTTGFRVSVAGAGERTLPGHAYLAPDGFNMGVAADRRIVLSLEEPDAGLRPSVAHLFASVTAIYGAYSAAVLLTGMGKDGAEEMRLMRQRGALTIAQDLESSLVFGMPGEAVKLDAAAYILSPERIAAILESTVNQPIVLKGNS
jgi:two-component system chemotaxis response regulator CheB